MTAQEKWWRRTMLLSVALPLAVLAALLVVCLWLDAPATGLFLAGALLFGMGLFTMRRWVQEYEEGGAYVQAEPPRHTRAAAD